MFVKLQMEPQFVFSEVFQSKVSLSFILLTPWAKAIRKLFLSLLFEKIVNYFPLYFLFHK